MYLTKYFRTIHKIVYGNYFCSETKKVIKVSEDGYIIGTNTRSKYYKNN